MLSANLSALFYLISGVLFILALRGLSSPETSRKGNLYGIIGMALAIGVTILSIGNFSSGIIYLIICLALGGSIGTFIAFKIPMTAMPELVAGFHSLVGLADVFVAISAFLNPTVFNLGEPGNIKIAGFKPEPLAGNTSKEGRFISVILIISSTGFNNVVSVEVDRDSLSLQIIFLKLLKDSVEWFEQLINR